MIETLYNDFTTKLLPKIQEGLVITKDYFLDLFGRYVKYLIITDSIYLGISSIVTIISIYYLFKAIKSKEMGTGYNRDDWAGWRIILCALSSIGILVGVISTICNITNLVKDIYLPEVRVIEELKSFNQ